MVTLVMTAGRSSLFALHSKIVLSSEDVTGNVKTLLVEIAPKSALRVSSVWSRTWRPSLFQVIRDNGLLPLDVQVSVT